MDFYNPTRTSTFLIDRTKWWWLPHEDGGTTLVVSVTKSEAEIWIVAYTFLVGLIFMAACYLATAIILTTFKSGTSGTRHAMLVSYYNGGSPSGTILPMLGYFRNAVWNCRKGGNWCVDWGTVWASSGLFLLAVFLLSGNLVTSFLLGGKRLVVKNVAQANPDAVFYPAFDIENNNNSVSVSPDIVDAIRTLVPQAIYQANSRRRNAEQRLRERVKLRSEALMDGTLLPDGSRQNGTGARFQYQYFLTGLEMGLRDAPELVYKVQGICATYHKSDGINSISFNFPKNTGIWEEEDDYPFPNPTQEDWEISVYLSRENYTAPWAEYFYDDSTEAISKAKTNGEHTFLIVPHIAWRPSEKQNPKPDPWYETEQNPSFVEGKTYNSEYRVKRARPALRCTQHDTYTYKKNTVNHVDKLQDLQGLNLSPFIKYTVFGREFGTPVFSKLLGNLPFGTLASTAYFDPHTRLLDVSRVSLEEDFRGLVETGFVYSREVVRNTVLLYSFLNGRKETGFRNAADEYEGRVKNTDFFIEGAGVAAMSVFVMVVTPSVCVLLWILFYGWKNWIIPGFSLDNKSAKARHGLRDHAFRAVTIFRYLDEELSRKRKWSGRDTSTPYIRDLDAQQDEIDINILPASATVAQSPTTMDIGVKGDEVATPTTRCTSQYAKPKVLLVQGPHELPHPSFFERAWNMVKGWIRDSPPETSGGQQLEVVMTRVWDPKLPAMKWKNVRRDVTQHNQPV
ncbi:hypothetical protein EV426DRAFT_622848 [Tirmania nivea]|nr:hypothetical protein EV426DRAFT_622848 [Tirmania nivea]